MQKNVSRNDATIRTYSAVVLAIFALFVVDITWLKIVLATAAAILAGTAFLGTCPFYSVLKKTGAKSRSEDEVPDTTPSEPEPATPEATSEKVGK